MVLAVPLLPLAGFVVLGAVGKRAGNAFVSAVGCGTLAAAFALSLALFAAHSGAPAHVVAAEWIRAGSLSVPIELAVDPLTLVMLLVITGVGLLIHVYSIGYMHGDAGYARFFA